MFYRLITWRSRAIPDFLILGAQKAGTSSLSAYLNQHPQLFLSFQKEVHYFDGGVIPSSDNFAKGHSWYRSFFPRRGDMGESALAFEASPLYLFNPLVPKRIFAFSPKIKLIIILRNPVDRAISHYLHERRKGREKLAIEEALRAEEVRLQLALKNRDYKSSSFMHKSYKSRGIYHKQIAAFLEYFPRDGILILNSEEMFSEPDYVLKIILDFLGVNPDFKIEDLRPRNAATNRDLVSADVYRYLNEYFFPHNKKLYELIDKDYGW